MPFTISYEQDQQLVINPGTTIYQLLELLPPRPAPVVAALVNGQLEELDYPLKEGNQVQFIDINSSAGWLIHRRSLTFLLQLAIRRCCPGYYLWVSHSLSEGLFCWAENEAGQRLSLEQIAAVELQMHDYVAENLLIRKTKTSKEAAIALFEAQGNLDKARLLRRLNQPQIDIYQAEDMEEYLFGKLAVYAGVLGGFRLLPFEDGFTLRLPPMTYLGLHEPSLVQPQKLHTMLRDYHDWSELLSIRTISDLNALIDSGGRNFADLVLIAETLQERILHHITNQIEAVFPQVRLILLAGPTSSGKTTTANRLAIQFKTMGIKPLLISMDDYFLDSSQTPVNERGLPDYEGIAAMDMAAFENDISSLLQGREVSLPYYDFKLGKSIKNNRTTWLGDDQILIVEGIHALNNSISDHIPANQKRKIFVSALTQLNLDHITPFSSSDNRMIRRIVRDAISRNTSPTRTLCHWEEVRRGEHHNIFPYQEEADFFINSALIYELPVLRPLIEDKLAAITKDESCYNEAQRLLQLIRFFSPAPADIVPMNSILQEFIGNSIFPL